MKVRDNTNAPVLMAADGRQIYSTDPGLQWLKPLVAIAIGFRDNPASWQIGFITTQEYDAHVIERDGHKYYQS